MPTSRSLARRASLVVPALSTTLALAACGSDGGGSRRGAASGENEPAAAAAVEPIGTYAVGRTTQTFVDRSRPTGPNGSFPGSDSRELFTTTYYPAEGAFAPDPVDDAPALEDEGPFPLIFFSHGVLAHGRVYEHNIEQWVSAGYVVVAPDYPLTKTTAPGGASFGTVGDVANQPADATFVLDQVLDLDAAGELAGGVIDPERIGAAGHSLGAITTFRWVYENTATEDRIDAAVPMSGVAGGTDDFFATAETPLLVLHGDRDPLVPYRGGVDAFRFARPPKFLFTFTGAEHINPFVSGDDAQNAALNEGMLAFLDRYLKDDRQALARLRGAARDPVVATLQEQER